MTAVKSGYKREPYKVGDYLQIFWPLPGYTKTDFISKIERKYGGKWEYRGKRSVDGLLVDMYRRYK